MCINLYVCFSLWLISLCMTVCRSIHACAIGTTYTTRCIADHQRGPTLQHRDLYSALWWPEWEGHPEKRGCPADSAVHQTLTALWNNYTSMQVFFPKNSSTLWLIRASQVVLRIKEPACQWRRHKGCGLDSCAGQIPWRRKWQPHSSIVAWRTGWTEEPGELQSMGSQRVWHDRSELTHTHTQWIIQRETCCKLIC